jgi:ribosomal protein S18 acetylase RimI-like enzyme
MKEVSVGPISLEQARRIRQVVLRPGHPIETTHLRGDHHPASLHVGAFLDGDLVGCASVAPQSPAGLERTGDWQLSGVGVLEKARRLGCGHEMVQACLDYIASLGGSRVWCHARTSTLRFYASMGFRAEGEEFNIPISGPHYTMWRKVER